MDLGHGCTLRARARTRDKLVGLVFLAAAAEGTLKTEKEEEK